MDKEGLRNRHKSKQNRIISRISISDDEKKEGRSLINLKKGEVVPDSCPAQTADIHRQAPELQNRSEKASDTSVIVQRSELSKRKKDSGIYRIRVVSSVNDKAENDKKTGRNTSTSSDNKININSALRNAVAVQKIRKINHALDRTQHRVVTAGKRTIDDRTKQMKRVLTLGRWNETKAQEKKSAKTEIKRSQSLKGAGRTNRKRNDKKSIHSRNKNPKKGNRIISMGIGALVSSEATGDTRNDNAGNATVTSMAVSLIIKFITLTVMIVQIIAKLIMIVVTAIIFIIVAVITNVSFIVIMLAAMAALLATIVSFIVAEEEDKDEDDSSGMGWYHYSDAYEELEHNYEEQIQFIIDEHECDGYRIEGKKASAEDITSIYLTLIHSSGVESMNSELGMLDDMIDIEGYDLLTDVYWKFNAVEYTTETRTDTIVEEYTDSAGNKRKKKVKVEREILVITAVSENIEDVLKGYGKTEFDMKNSIARARGQLTVYLNSIKYEYLIPVGEVIYDDKEESNEENSEASDSGKTGNG